MQQTRIDIVSSVDIDTIKWNSCVESSRNPLIYAYTWYLDYMTDNWSGIVINDYEAVMPVPWRKKFGIIYTYTVPFIQQLGGFTKAEFAQDFFLKALIDNYSYGDYNFHYNHQSLALQPLTNYTLDLSLHYALLKQRYHIDLLQNLNKAAKENIFYVNADYKEAVSMYEKLYGDRMLNVKPRDYQNLLQLCTHLAGANKVMARKVTDSNNETLAIALLLSDGRRLYNLANSVSNAGRKKAANHFLFDALIREFAGTGLILDFEGSDIPGVKHFYKNFGGENQFYYACHFNRLPAPLRWLKP
ncbi:hypothetical protein I5907_09220 [Panacibacter sp. DH6]|uniref:GNAT family N-acetyltransferase n=1 Tax=Panacibacter microcysteis TaxID=2793269 RepID=A0A931E592_9BACT|nr:hypothetical protein [Panacibacter microcysteis]MBG9376412.1 hypothetical protein [Panacibacter microcysteis]